MNQKYSIILFILGVLTGISFSFIYLLPISIISFAFLIFYLEKKKLNESFLIGWIFGIGFFLGSMHWIIFPFLVYEKHYFLAPIIFIIFPSFLGLFFAIPSTLIFWFSKYIDNRFIFLKSFIISFFFFFSELLRSNIFGGLPFNLFSHIWAFNSEFTKVSSVVGVFGLSFLTINWFITLAYSVLKRKVYFLFVFFTFPIFLYYFPFLTDKETQSNSKYLDIRIIQPNIPQEEKWNKLMIPRHIDKLISMTNNNLVLDKKILVIWPEVAIPFYLNEEDELLKYIRESVPPNVTIITGALRREFLNKSFRIYNSIFIVDRENINFYDKQKLVPFGEFIPFKNVLKIVKLTDGSTDFSAGSLEKKINIFIDNNKLSIEPLICYEAIFQSLNRDDLDFIINITNDAWFGKTIGPRQHLAASIFRSIEKGVPLIRSANSGISVLTNSKGKILEKIDLNKQGFINSTIKIENKKTIFSKYGNKLLFLVFGCLFFFNLALDFIFKRKKD